MTDEELAQRAGEGEANAFQLLYDRHKVGIYNYALRFLRDRALAEDVAQQVFLSVYESIQQYDERRGRFKSWLFAVAHHECARSKKRRRRLLFGYSENLGATGPAKHPDAERDSDVRLDLERALLRLDQKFRLPIVLTKLHGFSVAETAAILGISEANVKQRVFRGMNRLRQFYARPKP